MNTVQVESQTGVNSVDREVDFKNVLEDLESALPIFQELDIKMLDEDLEDELQLFSYYDCTNADLPNKKLCRGLIYEAGKLLVSTFPYSDEYNHREEKELETALRSFSDWSFFDSFEGTLVRFYHTGGVWRLSTHRKLDAFRSKWSCKKSFGELFVAGLLAEAVENKSLTTLTLFEPSALLEQLGSLLNKDRVHTFLIGNNKENRIVCNGTGKLYYIGSFGKGSRDFSTENPLNFPSPRKLEFETLEALLEYVEKIPYREYQGIFCYNQNTGVQIKIVHSEYQKLFAVRGNQPSLRYRYLQVRMNHELREQFINLYPDSKKDFEEYETYLKEIASFIYRSYVNRFIKKIHTEVPKQEYAVIRTCHAWHMENRDRNKINLEKVMKVLNTHHPSSLNSMIKRLRAETESSVNLAMNPWNYRSPYLSAVLTGSGPTLSNLSI